MSPRAVPSRDHLSWSGPRKSENSVGVARRLGLVGKQTRNSPSITGILARHPQGGQCVGAIARQFHRPMLEKQSKQREVCSLPLCHIPIRKSRILAATKTVLIRLCVSKLLELTDVRSVSGVTN